MELPPNASLFTYNAVAMYPSINMAQYILHLSEYLSSPEITSKYGFSYKALIEALTLVMLNNRMRFGDIIVKQLSGIAMGMSPAPTIANLFVAIYETTHVIPYSPQVMLYLCRFIDDGVGDWLHDLDPLVDESNRLNFQACLNDSGLKWIFSERMTEVVFMDLQLKIEAKKVVTSLHAKPMALHLYIPPHSCHAPEHCVWECTTNPPAVLLCCRCHPRTQDLPPPPSRLWVSIGPAHPALSTSNR